MTLTKKKGGVYYATIKTAAGQTKSITTRTTNQADARKVVKESGISDLEMAAKAGRLTTEAIGHITTGKKLTIIKAIALYEAWFKKLGKSPRTVENNVSAVRNWAKDMKLESLPPAAINENHISPWINDEDSDAKAGTRNVLLAGFRSFFAFCCAKGWSVGDPSHLVRVNLSLLDHAQKETTERVPITKQECKTLLHVTSADGRNASAFWHFAILMSWETGLRLGDICQLEWDCFKKPGKVIVWTDKRDARVAVPISEQLQEASSLIPVTDNQYLFPEQREMILDKNRRASLSVQFSRLCQANKIDKSFHCLRHAFATRMKEEGLSLEDIGVLMGHSGTDTTSDYVHE